ncbi:MAG TPA: LytR C-terminal domain-containing protein [Gemmatimonadales bacterium]|nr:LytR C-terminal domain-containing protein [Gemmatimonadales bacterium]
MAARSGNGGLLERARFALILALALASGCRHRTVPAAFAIPGDTGPALTVEVINTTGKTGLARSGTRLLRSAGLDVVNYFGSSGQALDSTRIVVRRGTVAAGERVRTVLQVGRVVVQLDSSRLVDVSVQLGADFAARAPLDFHP